MRRVVPILCAAWWLAGCGEETRRPAQTAPTARAVFLEDPQGQVETIAAGGHLVAWTVRTPADALPGENPETEPQPRQLPESTRIAIADERGGTPLSVEFGRRWVSRLRMIRGAAGEPQLAVRSCTARAESTCTDELLTLPGGTTTSAKPVAPRPQFHVPLTRPQEG